MFAVWDEGSPYWEVALAYVFIGIGVGLAGTPASHSLTGSVPVRGPGWRREPRTFSATWAGRSCSPFSAPCSRPGTRGPHGVHRDGAVRRGGHGQRPNQLTKSFSSAADAARSTRSTRRDHRGRQGLVPGRRRLGLRGRAHGRPAGRRPRLLRVPQEGRGAAAARRVPRERRSGERRSRPAQPLDAV